MRLRFASGFFTALCLLAANLAAPQPVLAHTMAGQTQGVQDPVDPAWTFTASSGLSSPVNNAIYQGGAVFVTVSSDTNHYVRANGPAFGLTSVTFTMKIYNNLSEKGRHADTNKNITLDAMGRWERYAELTADVSPNWGANYAKADAEIISGAAGVGTSHTHGYSVGQP